MIYSKEVENMCSVCKGAYHGPAPIPEEGKWIQAKEIKDISGYTHGIGWCAPQQGACKLSLNVKDGVIQEALVETIGCTGMTHSAAMASEILPGKTILEALNTDLVCDAINTAMRELFLQIVYGRTQSAFSEGGLAIGTDWYALWHCCQGYPLPGAHRRLHHQDVSRQQQRGLRLRVCTLGQDDGSHQERNGCQRGYEEEHRFLRSHD